MTDVSEPNLVQEKRQRVSSLEHTHHGKMQSSAYYINDNITLEDLNIDKPQFSSEAGMTRLNNIHIGNKPQSAKPKKISNKLGSRLATQPSGPMQTQSNESHAQNVDQPSGHADSMS